MTDGIGRIINGGDGGFGIGGFAYRRKEETAPQVDKQPVPVERETVDPDKVMEMLSAANSQFVQAKKEVKPAKLDEATVGRIAGYMARFEETFEIAKKEVGPLATEVLDMMSDKLLKDLK